MENSSAGRGGRGDPVAAAAAAGEGGASRGPCPSQQPSSAGGGHVEPHGPHGHVAMATSALCSVRSMSVASISSEGSTESHGHGVEQEEIAALTHDVRAFKEALGQLRRLFHSDRAEMSAESLRVAAHERLGEVLRILRTVFDKHPALQYTELLMAAGSLIQQVKDYDYEEEKMKPKEFFECVDHIAFAFSRRISEYLMGDLDSSASLSSSVSSKTKSYETLASRTAPRGWGRQPATAEDGGSCIFVSAEQPPDSELLRTEQAVEALLRRAKLCAKYLKDVITYAEKRAHLDLEYSKNLSKLAQTVRPLISEEVHLPLQSTYFTALDHDISNCNALQTTSSLILGAKFLEPMSARRTEHERRRKQLKEVWHRELKRMQEAEVSKRKAHGLMVQRQQALRTSDQLQGPQQQQQEQPLSAGAVAASRLTDRRRRAEDEAFQKALEAENSYRVTSMEVEERALQLQRVKAEVLHSLQALLLQYDQTLKAATVNYFQLQHEASSRAPTQFQTLHESSCLYDPGAQYHEFVKRFCALASQKHTHETAVSYPPAADPLDNDFSLNPQGPDGKGFSKKAWSSSSQAGLGSDTDSSHSTKSREPSPTNPPAAAPSRPSHSSASGDELERAPPDIGTAAQQHANGMSKASKSHKFRTIIGANYRCQECDTKIYLQALECSECGLVCHRECTKTLTILCGPTRLPERLSVFGVELAQHLAESRVPVPHILTKCIKEMDENCLTIKGIYRVSGVKSKVEKLCQDFETGADRVDLHGINAHVIASVLKLYLRQLPEPLLTFQLYPSFVRIARDWPVAEENADLSELQELVRSLPPHHFNSLSVLMQHLYRVASHADANSMPPSNLGIVFGPTLLRTPEGSASLSCLVDTVHQTKAIEILIKNTRSLFPGTPVAPAATSQSSRVEVKMVEQHVTASQQSVMEVVLPGFISETSVKEHFSEFESTLSQDDVILGFASDEDLPDSLLPDCSPLMPPSPLLRRSEAPLIFRTTLRNYQGLEGADSLIMNQSSADSESSKAKKKMESIEKRVEGDKEVPKTAAVAAKSTATLARVESLADSDFESHLSSSLESPSPKDEEDCKQQDDASSKTDPSAPTSSLEESHSEGERDDLHRPTVAADECARAATAETCSVVTTTSSTSRGLLHSTKHHFSIVSSHLVGRRSSSVRAESSSSCTRTASAEQETSKSVHTKQTLHKSLEHTECHEQMK